MEKKIIFGLFIISVFVFSGCTQIGLGEDKKIVTDFDSCVDAGYVVMQSYPPKCSDGVNTYVKQIDDDIKPCTREYMPVCGEIQVQCIRAPCPPIRTTFPNMCEAQNAKAINIIEGECKDDLWNPEGACLSFDGNWDDETDTCAWMSREQCDEMGGVFEECGSACKDSDTQACIAVCVPECRFGNTPLPGSDRDEHGCIPSAGYSWEEEIGQCVRMWEKDNICTLAGGKWLEQYSECEYISRSLCEKYEGRFSECESACRNNPEAQMCTMQCVQVCDFKA